MKAGSEKAIELQQIIKNPTRRSFVRSALVGGAISPLIVAHKAFGAAEPTTVTDDELCQPIPASTMLALYSTLVWKLPNRLKEAEEIKQIETRLFQDFNSGFEKLVELAKQLKVSCESNSIKDPRIDEIEDLATTGLKNAEFLKTSSDKERDLAFLSLTTLAVASQQIARNATDLSPEGGVLPDKDQDTICKMKKQIEELEKIRAPLRQAREDFQEVFSDFVNSINSLNEALLDASEWAALSERGELDKDAALGRIEDAKFILESLEDDSNVRDSDSLDPESLLQLVNIAEETFLGGLSDVTVTRKATGNAYFQNAAFDRSAAAYDRRILRILRANVQPSDGFTMAILRWSCARIIRRYGGTPPRFKLLVNTIRVIPWLDRRNSNIKIAAEKISALV